jgi:hypothetical protein
MPKIAKKLDLSKVIYLPKREAQFQMLLNELDALVRRYRAVSAALRKPGKANRRGV